jgi:hypothetical protein
MTTMNDIKKHIYLAVGLVALYLAAKEYGINSLDDLKKTLKPYLGVLDMDEINSLLHTDDSSAPGEGQTRMSGVPHES